MCMDTKNMELYAQFKECPEEAKKSITGGRLRGKTDINPMWRIKKLTEVFGPCGVGWTTKIERTWIEEGSNGVRTANVEISLKFKYEGEWSEPIPGIGGAALIAKEDGGLFTDDDCYKKAYTDAISVACKALGIAADVYYERDPDGKYDTYTKSDGEAPSPKAQSKPQPQPQNSAKSKYQAIKDLLVGKTITMDKVEDWIMAKFGAKIRINDLTDAQFNELKTAVMGAA